MLWQVASVASDPAKRRTQQHLQHLREGRKEETDFDAYWDTLSAEQQAELRALEPPIIPYREMPMPRYSFPIYASDKKFAGADPRKDDEREGWEEGWVTRERMQEVIADVLAMLGASPDKAVQHHFDLIRIVLQQPDAPTQVDLAHRMGLTKQAVCVRAKNLILRATSIAPGLLERISQQPALEFYPELQNSAADDAQGGAEGIFLPPATLGRGSSTTAKKHRIPSGGGQETKV